MPVRIKIRGMYDEFSRLISTQQERRTGKWLEDYLNPFLGKLKLCLDISCKDPVAIKRMEKNYKVKMSSLEHDFLADQLNERKMICTTEVDR